MDEIYYKPLLSLTLGLILIFVIKGRDERKRKILSNCKETVGLVVDQEKGFRSSGGGDSPVYYPILRFETDDEILIKQTYTEGRKPIKYATGQEVTIQYLVDDPKEFLIKGDDTRLAYGIFLLIGIGFILYSAFLLFNIFLP